MALYQISENPKSQGSYSWQSISSSYPITNAYAPYNSTSYAYIQTKSGKSVESYVFLGFNLDIPETAQIDSVQGWAKAKISTTQGVGTYNMLLYNGNNGTAKGSAVTMGTTTTYYTLNCGSWTALELNNCYIKFYVKRNTSGLATRTCYLYIYGATLQVTYTVDETQYTITTTVNNGTLLDPSESPVSLVSGSDYTLHFKGNDGYTLQSMTVNGVTALPTEHTGKYLANGLALFHNEIIELTDEFGLSTVIEKPSVAVSSGTKKFGGASLLFTAANSSYYHFQLPENPSACTVEFWFYTSEARGSTTPTIFSTTSAGNYGGTYFKIDDGSYGASCVCACNNNTGTSSSSSYGSMTITRNAWHHFAYTTDGEGNHYFFVDGLLQRNLILTAPNSILDIYIGGLKIASGMRDNNYFSGYIDEILVSNNCKWTENFTVPSSLYNPISGPTYSYVITDLGEDTVVVATFAQSGTGVFLKVNNAWVQVQEVYHKENNVWVKVTSNYLDYIKPNFKYLEV